MKKSAKRKPKGGGPALVQSAEIAAFDDYLKSLRSVLAGWNYVTHFEAKYFRLAGDYLPIKEIMLLAYPASKPDEARIMQWPVETMIEEVNPCLSVPWYAKEGHSETDTDTAAVASRRTDFWRHLQNCIDYDLADVYSYGSEVGLPGYHVFWRFAWLIHSPAQKRCVFLYGVSSD